MVSYTNLEALQQEGKKMTSRDEQIKWANKLQMVLGAGYEIRYDANDSGMTKCFHNGVLYKTVENSVMNGSINVYDYKA